MTLRQAGRQGRRPPGACLFGIETEYPFAVLHGDASRDRCGDLIALMQAVRALTPTLPCTDGEDFFVGNGARVYVDAGMHPEVATPECATPHEAVLYSRAGDLLLARACRSVERSCPGSIALLWKANVDHCSNATWGSHESYLHTASQSQIARQLTTHLVTRIVYTGAGGFDNLDANPRFVLSPRGLHLELAVSAGSTHGRGIIHTRDRPLACAPFQRLHVLAGESLWSQTAEYLRIGTTALLLAQIDAGRRPQAALDLVDPVAALGRVTRDVRCTEALPLRRTRKLTALEIQRRLLDGVVADLGADYLPPWAEEVCRGWVDVLDRLRESPADLAGILDWPTKLALLRQRCTQEDLAWTFTGDALRSDGCDRARRAGANDIARLRAADLHFTRLDEHGIFATLDREGALAHRVVSDAAIEQALLRPPSTARPGVRARYIRRFAGNASAFRCYWDRIVNRERRKVLDLSDPFVPRPVRWRREPPMPRLGRSVPQPALAPVQRAIESGRPREALRLMRALLRGPDPVSRQTCHYCLRCLRHLVPMRPVPLLRRGSAMAGPTLKALLARCETIGYATLVVEIEELLSRWLEGRGRYAEARAVLEGQLQRIRGSSGQATIASLCNNIGYGYLLERDWRNAEKLLRRSLARYTRLGYAFNIANARANLLESRFGRLDPEDWHTLLADLTATHRAMRAQGVWQVRKTYRLLARYAEHRGRRKIAIRWARLAVRASRGVETRLQDWDRAYLDSLSAAAHAT